MIPKWKTIFENQIGSKHKQTLLCGFVAYYKEIMDPNFINPAWIRVRIHKEIESDDSYQFQIDETKIKDEFFQKMIEGFIWGFLSLDRNETLNMYCVQSLYDGDTIQKYVFIPSADELYWFWKSID